MKLKILKSINAYGGDAHLAGEVVEIGKDISPEDARYAVSRGFAKRIDKPDDGAKEGAKTSAKKQK